MFKNRKFSYVLLTVLLMLSLILVGCSGTTTQPTEEAAPADTGTDAGTDADTDTGTDADTDAGSDTGEKVLIRWYVGLGTGSDESMGDPQEAVVEKFNASQDKIELKIEIVDNASASDVLKTQIAGGNPPDIVGPVGIAGRENFPGAWLDLNPLIEATNYDLSDFDPSLVEFYESGGDQLGIPFAIFPSFIYVNTDLFDEAGLPYPPQEYGAPYVDENGEEHEWNLDTLRMLAMKLTVDASGNDASSPDFNPEDIVQFGFGNQFTDIRGRLTLFGASNFIDENGKAAISDNWVEGIKWYHDAMWKDNFHPNDIYASSETLGGSSGNWFESGNLAMAQIHLWYAPCCMGGLEANWDAAVIPSYNGVTTAKMHADTFGILKASKNPEEAFEVLTFLLGDAANELTQIYGGMPARLSLQGSYFETLSATEQFAGLDINWDVVKNSMSYPDNPSHEAGLPSNLEARDRYVQFEQLWNNDPELDIDAELENLINDLQAIYDAAEVN